MSEAQLSELNDVIIVQGIIDAFFIEDGQVCIVLEASSEAEAVSQFDFYSNMSKNIPTDLFCGQDREYPIIDFVKQLDSDLLLYILCSEGKKERDYSCVEYMSNTEEEDRAFILKCVVKIIGVEPFLKIFAVV